MNPRLIDSLHRRGHFTDREALAALAVWAREDRDRNYQRAVRRAEYDAIGTAAFFAAAVGFGLGAWLVALAILALGFVMGNRAAGKERARWQEEFDDLPLLIGGKIIGRSPAR